MIQQYVERKLVILVPRPSSLLPLFRHNNPIRLVLSNVSFLHWRKLWLRKLMPLDQDDETRRWQSQVSTTVEGWLPNIFPGKALRHQEREEEGSEDVDISRCQCERACMYVCRFGAEPLTSWWFRGRVRTPVVGFSFPDLP